MPTVAQVVVTDEFAGVERYVYTTARELAIREWDVVIVGGSPLRMPQALGDRVRWLPGATPREALRSLASLGRQDVCHAHMTAAECVAVAALPVHRAPIVATRHFAARRGRRRVARALAPLIAASLSREIAISEFVSSRIESRPDVVLVNAVPFSSCLWHPSNRTVLVMQRLESEKETVTALRAWRLSRLWENGWSMRIVGAGSERLALERWAAAEHLEGVRFAGWVDDVQSELAGAGMMLATAPAEPFGLSVLEAMAAGVPVVACAAGGHLETVGPLVDAATFEPGNATAAAAQLVRLAEDPNARQLEGARLRARQQEVFSLDRHIARLEELYRSVLRPRSR